MEIWKEIKGYPNYMISNLGRVKSLNYNRTGEEKILKQTIDNNLYYVVVLCEEGKRKKYLVHRLVAKAFIDNPDNLPCVNHKDENKTNNCVSNLEFCTHQYNINYGTHNERVGKANSIAKKGKSNIALSKPIVQMHKSGLIIGVYDSAHQVERELNINQSNITQCCNGKRKSCGGYKWKYLDKVKKAS